VFLTTKTRLAQDHSRMACSVLLVDDDPTFRSLARDLITDCGMVVVAEADTVAAARAMATRTRPSAALVDVGLPDGDGFTLTRELTALPWRPRVVLISEASHVGSPDEVRRSGAQAFVHKSDLPDVPLGRLLASD
jgi:DNA-binding NarL/FixJ family response regulator